MRVSRAGPWLIERLLKRLRKMLKIASKERKYQGRLTGEGSASLLRGSSSGKVIIIDCMIE